MATLAELKAIAAAIKTETTVGANTASRVGTLIEQFIDAAIVMNASINTLNSSVFAENIIHIASGDHYDIVDGDKRYHLVSSVDDHAVINIPLSADNVGMIITIVCKGSNTVDATLIAGDTINDSGAVRSLNSVILSIRSFGAAGWWII